MAGHSHPDESSQFTLLAASSVDEISPVELWANPTTHRLLVDVTGSDGAILDGVDSDIKATVLDYTNSNPLAVRLTNTDGDYVSAGKPLPVEITDASVAVTGTFWQATQPVSGTFWQATQPVSGTFWQATQPVRIAQDVMLGTDFSNVFGAASLISATPAVKVEQQGSVAVTGTFWQATQPVSIAGTVTV